jgi:predicted TIM-barrel fold metal-dependent hydrolase
MLGPICDAHLHVFGPPDRYPLVANPRSTPPESPLERYLALANAEGIERMVFVAPSHYGTDNRYLIDALERVGDRRARGVIAVDDATSAQQLRAFDAAGARAIRVNFGNTQEDDAALPARVYDIALREFRRVADLGWHIDFLAPNWVLRRIVEELLAFPGDYTIAHFANFQAVDGPTQPGLDDFLRLLDTGRCWIKLSGIYRISKRPDFGDVEPMVRRFVAANPDRLIWGSDWPFLSHLDATTLAQLLDLFEAWCPSAEVRRKILVDNAQRLFGFGAPAASERIEA